MDQLPAKSVVREFRAYLDVNDYNESSLNARIGTAYPPRADNLNRLAYVSREATPQNALVRLFLLGSSVERAAAAKIFPASFIELCMVNGLLGVDEDRLKANVVIVAVEDLLFASDAFRVLDTDKAVDFVLPASTHSANHLRRLTMRSNIGSVLDLGCGCGVHALFAARHGERVIATDISPAAIRYTTFNSWLNNVDNVECLVGDRFDPVAGLSFDLIVSNPPFVLGPYNSFVYRDSELELDEFSQMLIRQAPDFLKENGCLQMLCETVEFSGEPWHRRMKSWFADTHCDAWILHSPALHPVQYVSQRVADLSDGNARDIKQFDHWVDYFETRKVTAIHPVMIAMRRRAGSNWLHVHNLVGDVENDAGDAVRKNIIACDFLERCSRDDTLLDSTLTLSPDMSLEQQFSRQDGLWQPQISVMRMTDGLPMDAEVDMPILAFLNQIDGETSLRGALDRFSEAVGADVTNLTANLLPIVRVLIGRGFLEPVPGLSQK